MARHVIRVFLSPFVSAVGTDPMHTIAPTAPEVGTGWRQGLPKLTIGASFVFSDRAIPGEVRRPRSQAHRQCPGLGDFQLESACKNLWSALGCEVRSPIEAFILPLTDASSGREQAPAGEDNEDQGARRTANRIFRQ